MSILGRKVSTKAVGALALLMVVCAMLPVLTKAPEREIVLVARGMAFYLEGDPATPNPTIDVRAGERVRVVLRNDERGMSHDFAVPAVGAATGLLAWRESDAAVIDVPREPGNYRYECRPHRLMMYGAIRVHGAS